MHPQAWIESDREARGGYALLRTEDFESPVGDMTNVNIKRGRFIALGHTHVELDPALQTSRRTMP
jgi:hypothetical protein